MLAARLEELSARLERIEAAASPPSPQQVAQLR